jgi:hypothetical protein
MRHCPLMTNWVVRAARILAASTVCAALAAGCGRHPSQPDPFSLGQSFELRAGSSAIVEGGLTIAFSGVKSDSRCPMDALCVWAGDAIVTVSLSQSGVDPAERELHTASTGSEASYRAYSVKLVALAPYPRSDRQIRPGDYVATLAISSR